MIPHDPLTVNKVDDEAKVLFWEKVNYCIQVDQATELYVVVVDEETA